MARYFAFPWRVGQRALYAALFLSMAALLLLVPARPARADEPCTITLVDNAATVYWINSSSWDQQRLPGPDDFVCIPAGNPGAEVWIQDDMATLRGIRSERTLVLVRSWLTLTDAAVPSVIDGLLDLRDGNLDNQTTLTVTHLALEQGALGGSGRTIVPPGGTLEVPGLPNERLWDGHTLVNQGTATFTNAGLYIQQGARFINQGTATFNAGTVWSNGQDYPTAPSGLIVNTGTLVKTGSGDTLTLQVPLNNTGTVRVEQGALELRTPGAPQGGEFVVDGQLSFSNPDTTHVFGAGASVHGVGQLVVNGSTVAMGGSYNMAETTALAGQLTLEQPATLATVNVYGGTVLAQADLAVNSANLNGGTLLAQANLAVTNGWLFGGTLESNGTTSLHQVNWFKGTLGGSGRTIIPSDGTIFINPYDFTTWKAIADGHTVEIQGTGHSSQALLTLGAGATLLNRGTLYLTATEAALGQISSLDGSGTLLNEGMLHITGTYTASANLVNAGIIQVNLGTLRLDNGAEHTGTFVVHDTLSFSGGTHRLAAGSAVSGFGTVVLTDGTLQVDGDYTVAGTEVRAGNLAPGVPLTFNAVVVNGGRLQADVPTTVSHLTLSSGTLAGTADLTATDFTWTGGYLYGAKTIIPADGQLTINAGGALVPGYLYMGNTSRLENNGTVLFQRGILSTGTATVIDNTGTFDLQGEASLQATSSSGSIFLNEGTLKRTGPSGSYPEFMRLQNYGTLEVQTGKVYLYRGLNNLAQGYLTGGTYRVSSGASLQLPDNTKIPHNNAHLWLEGASGIYYYDTNTRVNTDVFQGLSSNEGFATITLVNGKTVSTGSFLNKGTVVIDNSTWAGSGTYSQGGGQTTLVNGTIRLDVYISAGTVTGTGVLGGNVTNRARLKPGGADVPGQLIIGGAYTESAGAILRIRAGGITPGVDSDLLRVQGQATLAGTLEVLMQPGYTPGPSDAISVLEAAGRQGTFAAAQPGTTAGALEPSYTNGGVVLTPSAAPVWQSDSVLTVSGVTETSATLAWPAASDNGAVRDYLIYLNGTQYTSSLSPGYTLTWLDPGRTYHVEVRARDTLWLTSEPLALDFTTLDTHLPEWPAGAALTAAGMGEGYADLTWTAATDNVGVTRYRLFVNGEVWRDDIADTAVRVTGLKSQATYQFKLEAGDAAGNWSQYGLWVIADTPDLTAPVWPDGAEITLNAVYDETVMLAWPEATDNSQVTYYRLTANGSLVAEVPHNVREYQVTGLQAGTTYTFRVEARDTAGNWSPPLTRTVTTLDRTAPTWPAGAEITASEMTEEAMQLDWTPAHDNVGVTAYRLYRNDQLVTDDLLEPTAQVTGLRAATAYTFRVEAGDAAGNWSWSGPTLTVTTPDLTAPSWPDSAALTASEVGEASVKLSWPAATDNVAVTGYQLYSGETLLAEIDGPVTGFTINGLRPGARYQFRLYARDAAGHISATWLTAAVETPDWHAPFWADPPAITVDGVTTGSLVLHWPAAQDNVAVTGYQVFQDGNLLDTVTGTSYTVTGLTEGVSHEYRVQAGDAAGHWTTGGPALVAAAADRTAPVWQPGDSISIPGASVSETGALLTWPAASDTTAVTYRIYLNGSLLGSTEALSYLLGGLNPGTAYTVRVAAGDVADNWNQGLTASVTTRDGTAPVWPPASVLTASVSGDRVTLTWPGAQDNVGVTGYRIALDDTPLTEVAGLTYTLADVAPGDHRVAVAAIDAAGNVSPALEADVTVDDNRRPVWPDGAELTAVATGETTVDLQWPGAIDQSGRVTYLLLQNGVTVATLQGNEYTATNLRPGTRYTFAVKARDSSGNWAGPVLSTAVTTYDEHAPAWPAGSQLRLTSATAHSVTLTWTTAADNSGKVTYRLDVNGVPGAECGKAPCTVDDLQPDTAYQIQVWAGDAAGQWTVGPALQVQTKADGLVPVREATYAGKQVTLVFAERLSTAHRPAARDFRVNVNGTALTPGKVSLEDRTVVLTLSQAVPAGATVTVDYAPAGAPMRTVSGTRVASFRGFEAHGDPAAPLTPDEGQTGAATKPVSLKATGREITLTFSGELKSDQVPAAKSFQVEVNGRPVAVSRMTVSGRTVTLTLLAPVPAGSTVTVSYRPGTPPLTDASGRTVGPFTRLRAETPTP